MARMKALAMTACLYGLLGFVSYYAIYMKHVKPLPVDAPLDRFSEGRALHHLWHLSERIGVRHEGSLGLIEAARYIKNELEIMGSKASSNIRIEVDEAFVDGSFNMLILGHSISLAYRNHTNILLRVSSVDAKDGDASVLVNGHFDSALGSPGAGDCGSCVASMLEAIRLIIDSKWVPPQPIIFLFNGAEEIFLLASHGFIKTHKWRESIGAFINIEASGTGGLDLVCQSGPGSWPSRVYAEAAVYPMAHSVAQDIFPMIPGDTDFRIFSKDYGNIPGLDIIFLIGGYYYHTTYDKLENIFPGSIQARGENLISILKAFSSSTELANLHQRSQNLAMRVNQTVEDRAIFFDFLSLYMVFYSKNTAGIIYHLPMFLVLFAPLLFKSSSVEFVSWTRGLLSILKGMALHILGLLLAVIIPALFSFCRLLLSKSAMNWYAHPWLALVMFMPGSFIGLLLPSFLSNSQSASTEEKWLGTSHWAAIAFNAAMPLVFLYFGGSAGFLQFIWAVLLIINLPIYRFCVNNFGHQSSISFFGYFVPLIVPTLFSLYTSGTLLQFLIEKMGMFGTVPEPFGYFIADIIIACVVGVAVGFSFGPVQSFLETWFSNSGSLKVLLHLSVIAMAFSSQLFPYSVTAPKRLVLQHSFETSENSVVQSSYSMAVSDANTFSFVFENAPEVVGFLKFENDSELRVSSSDKRSMLGLYPISRLLSQNVQFSVASGDVHIHYPTLPHLHVIKQSKSANQNRRVHVELQMGSLQEVWVAVLNITGPLASWSFSEQQLPAPEQLNGGPISYILRLSGSSSENWSFWLEANSTGSLRVELAVIDNHLDPQTVKLKHLFPPWVDVIAYSSFLSTYEL